MDRIVLDHLEGIRLNADTSSRYHNELQLLAAWQHGLRFLCQQVRAMEQIALAELTMSDAARDASNSPQAGCALPNLGCCFQWYAVTLCNYVELVGCIGRELDSSRSPPRDSLDKIIPAVLGYRNKVGAHSARAIRTKSNAAERFASLLPPSSLINGRYFAGAVMVSMRTSGTGSDSRRIEPWSLTLTHEELAPRYWPQPAAEPRTRISQGG